VSWDRLAWIQPTRIELAALLLLLLSLLFLRRAIAREQRGRMRASAAFLVLALALQAMQAAWTGSGPVWALVGPLSVLCFILGATGIATLVVFDVVLARLDVRTPAILRDLVHAIAVILITLVMLRIAGVDPFSLVTTSAVLTAVIGLALQTSIANIFAGLAVQIDRLIRIGDWIEVSGYAGRVLEVKWGSTELLTKTGNLVTVPNNRLLTAEVVNYSQPTRALRQAIRVGFHYRHPPNRVARVMIHAAHGVPGVLQSPPAECFPCEFADSAVTYELFYWIDDFEHDAQIAGAVRARVWYAAQRAALAIPYPIRTLHQEEAPEVVVVSDQERQERCAALASVELFSRLQPEDHEVLARRLHKIRFAAGERIIGEGDADDSLYVIVNGEVAVHIDADGARRELATLRAGDFFGEMSLMTGEPRAASCTARTEVTCYVVDHRAFQALLDVHPQVANEVSTILAHRNLALHGQRVDLSAEARTRAAAARSDLLARIRGFFHLE